MVTSLRASPFSLYVTPPVQHPAPSPLPRCLVTVLSFSLFFLIRASTPVVAVFSLTRVSVFCTWLSWFVCVIVSVPARRSTPLIVLRGLMSIPDQRSPVTLFHTPPCPRGTDHRIFANRICDP